MSFASSGRGLTRVRLEMRLKKRRTCHLPSTAPTTEQKEFRTASAGEGAKQSSNLFALWLHIKPFDQTALNVIDRTDCRDTSTFYHIQQHWTQRAQIFHDLGDIFPHAFFYKFSLR